MKAKEMTTREVQDAIWRRRVERLKRTGGLTRSELIRRANRGSWK
ncbi:MAG: hypothetical protein ACREDF_11700 [Thermoplasmata archaeon]